MQTISLMYRISGGSAWRHTCSECPYCRKEAGERDGAEPSLWKNRNAYHCLKHPEKAEWKPDWAACRFFPDMEVDRKEKKAVPAVKSRQKHIKKKTTKQEIKLKESESGQMLLDLSALC